MNPKLVFCTISGYGMTGPYRDYPSHGIAYDTWAGIVKVATDDDGFTYIPEHVSIGINAGPLFGALGILAAVIRARATGEGSYIDVAQSDAAAALDWYRSETWRAYERPESEVTGNKADGYERRAPGTAGMVEGVRYQVYETVGPRACPLHGVRAGLLEELLRGPRPHGPLRALAGLEVRRPRARATASSGPSCAPSSPPRRPRNGSTSADGSTRPSHRSTHPRRCSTTRSSPTASRSCPPTEVGADQLFTPLHFVGEDLPHPAKAPTVGQHSEAVLRSVLGYDDNRIAAAREGGAFGADA